MTPRPSRRTGERTCRARHCKAYELAVLFLVLSLAACGRQTGVATEESTVGNDAQKLPFDREPPSTGISPSHSLLPVATRLPEGTPITIRLQSALSSASSRSGDRFQGTLDDPIVIEGQTLVSRGAAVTGSVLEAKHSGRFDPGYLRIALLSLTVNGKPVAIETSSLFAKGGSREERSAAIIGKGAAGATAGVGTSAAPAQKEMVFDTERRLSFRLAQSVNLQ